MDEIIVRSFGKYPLGKIVAQHAKKLQQFVSSAGNSYMRDEAATKQARRWARWRPLMEQQARAKGEEGRKDSEGGRKTALNRR